MNKQAIWALAERLAKTYETRSPFEIAEARGVSLRYKNIGGLKGFYLLVDRCRYIVINSALGEEDRRMVAAHELGHDLLHQHLAKAAPLRDFLLYDAKSKPEYEANLLAADLLLEDAAITELTAEWDPISMGRMLGVNPNMITFKLVSMAGRGFRFNITGGFDSAFLGRG